MSLLAHLLSASRQKEGGRALANTTPLEREIDEIVVEIYGLTHEEKRMVEGK